MSQPVDPDRVQIRVRVLQHLVNLQDEFPTLAEFKILRTPGADYAARLIVPKTTFVPVWTALAESLDYDNFKTEVGRAHLTEPEYKSRLYQVWHVMHSLQTCKRQADAFRERDPSRYFRGSATDFKTRQQQQGFWPDSGRESRDSADDREDTEPAAVAPLPCTTVDRSHRLAIQVITPSDLRECDLVLVQRRRGEAPLENVAFLFDVEQYRRSAVAARDAAVLGCFERIPRSQLLFVRGKAAKQFFKSPAFGDVVCFCMTGIAPSKGVRVAVPLGLKRASVG